MTAYARRIEREFSHAASWPHSLLGGTLHAFAIADKMDHLLEECAGYPCAGVPANDADNGSPTILVVEDEELLRVTVSDILRGSAFDVREAATVSAAKRVLVSTPDIDVLFSDVRLPDGSGLELTKWCREVRPHVRILLTSGYYQDPIAADEFLVLPKPYPIATLLAVLKQLPSQRDARSRPTEVNANSALRIFDFQDAQCGRSRGRRE
ncbi:MAG: response regulator [Acetobacteraceae bacterium]|nr:response regulator [Acetobacteraceae bacterium]